VFEQQIIGGKLKCGAMDADGGVSFSCDDLEAALGVACVCLCVLASTQIEPGRAACNLDIKL